ncbi:regulatory protein [Maribacter ulvicola]|uniref:Regulatory protein RecX n=2 Tax=Maribacter ulvicola TaxID=228959 RepID=A0A1N6NWE9_9FLAO|nr:regulatory protein [Maribacter ulvicola]
MKKAISLRSRFFCLLFLKNMNQKLKGYTVQEATKKIESYCAYQDRCHKEVVSKLKDMGMIPLVVDTIIAQLIEDRFLNEERFAKSFARGKFNIKKWGKNRIVRELKFRDISKYNITTALKEIEPEAYLTTLDDLAHKRLQQITETNIQKRRKKLADYLLYRGWESHLVYEKLQELIK